MPGELDLPAWRSLYGAYVFLKTGIAPGESSTARMLQDPDLPKLRARLADELGELAGAINGTHRHKGLPDDAILEASQVGYWTFVQAIAEGIELDDLLPPNPVPELERGELLASLRKLAQIYGAPDGPGITALQLRLVLTRAVQACFTLAIDPNAACYYDLEQMRSRPYMLPYFSTLQP